MNSTVNQNSSEFLLLDCDRTPKCIRCKAETELNETDEIRVKTLRSLKSMISAEKKLHLDDDDEFLLRFLRARKFNCRRAFTLLKMYFVHRLKYPSLYENFSPSHMKHVMEHGIMNFLPYRSPSGCAVWVSRVGRWDLNVCSYEDSLRFGLMCMELASRNPVTQICGVVNILDLKDFSWSQLLHFTPGRLKCFVSAMQDSFPLRQKETHVVNQPSIFSILYAVLSPFLTEKIRKRILLHGSDMSKLHEYLPPEILPEDYGGYLGPFGNPKFYELLTDSEEMFLKCEKYGFKKR